MTLCEPAGGSALTRSGSPMGRCEGADRRPRLIAIGGEISIKVSQCHYCEHFAKRGMVLAWNYYLQCVLILLPMLAQTTPARMT